VKVEELLEELLEEPLEELPKELRVHAPNVIFAALTREYAVMGSPLHSALKKY